jgi:hypothetical protein
VESADAGDGQSKAVHLTLPEACVGTFEMVLDYLYRFHRDPRTELALPDLSADAALGALWLAGRLEMTGLQQQLAEHLQRAVTKRSAHAYLPAAVRLGLDKVRAAAMRRAAAGLAGMPAGACDGLPLEALEQLLGMVEEGGEAGAARDRVLASYLRAYDGRGRLDEEAYRRLARRHSAAAPRDAAERAEGGQGGEGEGEGVGAEDALLLLDMAIRCARKRWRAKAGRAPAGRAGALRREGGGAGSGTRGWSGGACGRRRGGSGGCGKRTWGGCLRGWWRACWGTTGWRRGARTRCTVLYHLIHIII